MQTLKKRKEKKWTLTKCKFAVHNVEVKNTNYKFKKLQLTSTLI